MSATRIRMVLKAATCWLASFTLTRYSQSQHAPTSSQRMASKRIHKILSKSVLLAVISYQQETDVYLGWSCTAGLQFQTSTWHFVMTAFSASQVASQQVQSRAFEIRHRSSPQELSTGSQSALVNQSWRYIKMFVHWIKYNQFSIHKFRTADIDDWLID